MCIIVKTEIDVKKGSIKTTFSNGRVRIRNGATHKARSNIHRLIWEHVNGPIPKGYEIDHINGVPYDNRISNLRIVTHKQNMENRHRPHSNNKSGVKGVSWCKSLNKWLAQIGNNGKVYNLGYYVTIDAAKAAYGNAAALLHTHNPHAAK